MEKRELAEEIINFCVKYRLLGNSKRLFLAKNRVEEELENIYFVENFIHMLIYKTKYKNVDIDRLKNLLIELEKVRLDLEYR